MSQNFRLSLAFMSEARACREDHAEPRIEDIFFPMPRHWGLRGDPYLWTALAAYMADDLDGIDFDRRFRDAFRMITGQDFDRAADDVQVVTLMHGGISSGTISMAWWRDVGYPLLSRRFADLQAAAEMFINTSSEQISSLFFPLPEKWGLRGDPYLWSALAVFLSMGGYEDDFEIDFRRAFKHLTGQEFDRAPDTFQAAKFAHGGMSSGMIMMEWWREEGLPLLRQRLAALDGKP